jgi:hypothetical protein
MDVQNQPQANSSQNPISKKQSQKKACALNPRTAKKKKERKKEKETRFNVLLSFLLLPPQFHRSLLLGLSRASS